MQFSIILQTFPDVNIKSNFFLYFINKRVKIINKHPYAGILPSPASYNFSDTNFREESQVNTFSAERAVELGEYIVRNKVTVRAAAEIFGVSKSTVHTDVTDRLRELDPRLYLKVREVLDINKAQRHIRGGMATKEKYLKLHTEELSMK